MSYSQLLGLGPLFLRLSTPDSSNLLPDLVLESLVEGRPVARGKEKFQMDEERRQDERYRNYID